MDVNNLEGALMWLAILTPLAIIGGAYQLITGIGHLLGIG
ncbi:hypothetical protein GCM10023319_52120 [Nocardia iowensis]